MKPPAALKSELQVHHLVFSHDAMPGYSRRKHGRSFRFFHPDGSALADPEERRRVLSLAVPPAYENVWICLKANGHLQATGFDQRGRKQYRYHPRWMEMSSDRKFGNLTAFARSLPVIRAKVAAALSEEGFERPRIAAGIVALLDSTGYRIGNRRYAKENKSYGLATLLARHLDRLPK
ncbi:MAG: hypothetical protein V4733_11595 [Verrucomicrobiota bacterium]